MRNIPLRFERALWGDAPSRRRWKCEPNVTCNDVGVQEGIGGAKDVVGTQNPKE